MFKKTSKNINPNKLILPTTTIYSGREVWKTGDPVVEGVEELLASDSRTIVSRDKRAYPHWSG